MIDEDAKRDEERRWRQRNAAIICRKCGAFGTVERDGARCGGLPGITYRCCDSCGHSVAKTSRRRREKL